MHIDVSDPGFIQFFNDLPAKSPESGTFRIFKRDDFWAAYGPDAMYAAMSVFKTTSVIKHLGGASRRLSSVAFNQLQATALLRDSLTAKQLKVEIWLQDNNKKNAKFILKHEVCIQLYLSVFK
jgi:DNA mismatch repair protein MSH2